MSRFRRVDAGLWGDAQFQALSDNAKLLWLYLLTGQEVTSLPGVVVAGRATLAEALGWEVPCLVAAFGEIEASTNDEGVPMAIADWAKRVVWLPKAFRHNTPANPNVVAGWRDHWRAVPECDLKLRAYDCLRTHVESLGERFTEPFQRVIQRPSTPGKAKQVQGMETVPVTVSISVPVTIPRARLSDPAPATAPDPAPEGETGEVRPAIPPPPPPPPAPPPAEEPPSAPATPPGVFAMPDDFPLTGEARAAAAMLGVRDIDDEWTKFRAQQTMNGRTSTARGWYAAFTGKWCVDAKRYQQRERDRDRARLGETEPARQARPPPPPTPRERVAQGALAAELAARVAAALAGEPARGSGVVAKAEAAEPEEASDVG